MPFGRAGYLSYQIFPAPGVKLWHFAAELLILSVTYPLCAFALNNTMDNLSEVCALKLTYFVCFCTIDYTQSYRGQLFPQWLSQVVMTGAQTCCPWMGEPAL